MPTDSARELRELLDKQALTELVHAYCNAADRQDYVKLRALYHDDAVDDHGAFSRGPVDTFIEKMTAAQPVTAILHHNITTTNFVVDGDRAEGEIYTIAFHTVRAGDTSFDVLLGGRYLDKYEKRSGVWKFTHRVIVTDWVVPNQPSAVDFEHPMVAGAPTGSPGSDDPSYSYFTLFRRGER
jgi:hypothetical protein